MRNELKAAQKNPAAPENELMLGSITTMERRPQSQITNGPARVSEPAARQWGESRVDAHAAAATQGVRQKAVAQDFDCDGFLDVIVADAEGKDVSIVAGDVVWANGGTSAPHSKLDPALAGLAEKVDKLGKDGNYSDGNVTVTKYLVRVWVETDESTSATLLKQLAQYHQSSDPTRTQLVPVMALNGTKCTSMTVDVRKLEEIAALPFVGRVLSRVPEVQIVK